MTTFGRSTVLQGDPDRSVIARTVSSADVTVDARVDKPVSEVAAQKQMIEPEAGIAWPAHALVVPEGVDALLWMPVTQRVGPAAADELSVGCTAVRVDECVIVPGRGRVDVEVGRRDIVVSGKHDRRAGLAQCRSVLPQPFKPGELVGKLCPWLRIAVRRINRGDEDAGDGRLDVSAPVAGCHWAGRSTPRAPGACPRP